MNKNRVKKTGVLRQVPDSYSYLDTNLVTTVCDSSNV